MNDVLLSSAPAPDAHPQLQLFAPLIGSWSLVVENLADDGSFETTSAEWHFSWALGGRALVDVWISPARDAGLPEEWGMSVRFYDHRIDRIRSTWHGPGRGWVIPFLAGPVDGGIRMEGTHEGKDVRWAFSDISPDRFKWSAEERPSGGTWRVRQRFDATRAAGPDAFGGDTPASRPPARPG